MVQGIALKRENREKILKPDILAKVISHIVRRYGWVTEKSRWRLVLSAFKLRKKDIWLLEKYLEERGYILKSRGLIAFTGKIFELLQNLDMQTKNYDEEIEKNERRANK